MVEDVLLNRDDAATETLITKAQDIATSAGGPAEKETAEWRNGTPSERIQHALLKGIVEHADYVKGRQEGQHHNDHAEQHPPLEAPRRLQVELQRRL